MRSIVWVVGSPRSGSNFMGVFLRKCGCDHMPLVTPEANSWNTEWAECAWTHYYAGTLLGIEPVVDFPIPERPEELDYEVVKEMQVYWQSRFAAATKQNKTLIVKSNFASFIWREIEEAFPKDCEHKLVITQRSKDKQIASLAERAKCDWKQADKYITSVTLSLNTMAEEWRKLNRTVCIVDFDAVQEDQEKELASHLDSLRVKPNLEAWQVFDSKKIRF